MFDVGNIFGGQTTLGDASAPRAIGHMPGHHHMGHRRGADGIGFIPDMRHAMHGFGKVYLGHQMPVVTQHSRFANVVAHQPMMMGVPGSGTQGIVLHGPLHGFGAGPDGLGAYFRR